MGLDANETERWLSRAAAAVGIGACGVFVLVSPEHRAPRAALLAALGLYLLAKIIVLALRLREGTTLWVAHICEIAALIVVGSVVWTGGAGPLRLAAVVALLLVGAGWRRRFSPAESEAS